MTNPEKLKKQKLDDEGDARVDILINGEDSTKAEKLQENPLKRDISNTEKRDISNTEIYHDGFIDLQGEDETTLQIKVNRLLYVHDEVVLMKNFPEKFLFKGYLCEVCDILHHSDNPSECQYEIIFDSEFDDNDKSRESQKSNPNFEFPSTGISHIVNGDDIARLHDQDLRYKTFFL